ncbi:hypothetical protein [Lacticaseibacillus paracasei]|jgi:hypothetical protein|uniref:hypothetical protein n=1 Tax=Lacticaseibacillus paracasei TaxID=1597 RepID=UPI000FF79538|nr:hypothetical protein [Lacticaseibacillus paracasei]RNE42532.1 hypothetical protein FAM8374_02550 [Lacticaseibacillus paracasei]
MLKRLKLLPAFLILTVFFHMKKTNGLAIDFTITDAYLLLSWLVSSPRYLVLFKRKAQAMARTGRSMKSYVDDMKKNVNVYQDFVNNTPVLMSELIENGGLDSFGAKLATFFFYLILLLVSPLVWFAGTVTNYLHLTKHH